MQTKKNSMTLIQKGIEMKKAKKLQEVIMKAAVYNSMNNGSK
jgi:hypothetical protein